MQEEVVESIIKLRGKCYLDMCGASGKTRTSIKFVLRVQELRPHFSLTVIVPTDNLKEQWLEELPKWGVKNYRVVVINGVTMRNEPLNTHITIIDEAHMFLRGKTFSRIYQLANGPYCIPMSGTWSDEDKRIMSAIMPCAYVLTQREAEAKGWVSQSVEYNLGIDLGPEERKAYEEVNQRSDEYFATFGHDFQTAQSCMTYGGALSYIRRNQLVQRGFTDGMLAKEYAKRANIWQDYTQKRVMFIQSHIGKIQVVADILNSLPDRKAITFGALIAPAEKLTELLFDAKTYHSGIKTIYVPNDVCERHGIKFNKKESVTKLGVKNVRSLYIKQFTANDFRILNTVKAADLGLDVKGVNCCIIYGRNSRAEKNYQRIWRATRAEEENKVALLVNVYLKNTKDEHWLKSCQKGRRGIVNVESVAELVKHFNKQLK